MNLQAKQFVLLVATIALVGAGCVPEAQKVSNLSPEAAAASISFVAEDTFVMRQTVFGLGGYLVKWLGGEETERTITIDAYESGQSVDLHWLSQEEVETDASVKVRKDYESKFGSLPIGEEAPPAPKRSFQTRERSGTLSSTALDEAEAILLPAFWQDGEQSTVDDNSLLWLTTAQYDKLVQSRRTTLNLGLFDDTLSSTLRITDEVKNILSRLKQEAQESTEKEDVLEIKASGSWGEYPIELNGERARVRVIKAQNTFGRYTILANRYNPLILEIILTPASQGSANIFSKENLLKAFSGYEIFKFTQTSSSNADPPLQ